MRQRSETDSGPTQLVIGGGEVQHPPPRPRVTCPECRKTVTLTNRGELHQHNYLDLRALPDVWEAIRAMTQSDHPDNDPEPEVIGPVRYFDPENRPLDRLWLFLLRFVPKPLRTRQPFGRYFHQPEHVAWAKREAKRMMDDLGWRS